MNFALCIEPFSPGDRIFYYPQAEDGKLEGTVAEIEIVEGEVIECRREPQADGKPDKWNVWVKLASHPFGKCCVDPAKCVLRS